MGKDIRKRGKLIAEQELKLNRGKEKNKCECSHTSHGELDVIPAKNKGKLTYICRSCQKEIDFTKIPEKTEVDNDGKVRVNANGQEIRLAIGLSDACNTVDRAIDTIKITLDLHNEKDKEMLDELAVIQYRVRNQITQLYGKSLSKSNGGNRKKRNDDNDSMWSKPQMNR